MCSKVTMGTATATVLIDNERTRVTKWRFPELGDNTGWHRHECGYIVVPTLDGVLEIKGADDSLTKSDLKTGVPYFRQKGVKHDVMNGNDGEYTFVEIEFLEN